MAWGGRQGSWARTKLWPARLGLAILLLGALGVGAAGPASAHAELVGSTPSDGQTLAVGPARILLRLSESVELDATRVALTDGTGREITPTFLRMQGGSSGETEQPMSLVIGLPHLGAGQYRLSWTTLSSDDLHVTDGVMVFGVGQQVHRAGLPPESTPSGGESAVRWVGLLGLGVVMGCYLLIVLLGAAPTPSSRAHAVVRRRLLAMALTGASAAVLAGAALPLTQAAQAAGTVTPTLRRLLLQESYAGWWWPHELALLGLLVLAVRERRAARATGPGRPTAAFAVLLAGVSVTTGVLMGHAGVRTQLRTTTVAVESLHVFSALLWSGTVVAAALVLCVRVPGSSLRYLRLLALRRFGAVAVASVPVAVLTGLLLAGRRIATPDALMHSVYGRVLLLKIVVVGLALTLGLLNAFLLRPQLLPVRVRGVVGQISGRFTVITEAAVVLVLLAATATLAAAPPATGPRWQPATGPAAPVSAQADDLVETLRVQPGVVGENFLSLRVFDTRRPSPGRVESVVISLRGPDGRTTRRVATAVGDGSWLVAGQPLSAGEWSARTTAARAGLPGAEATYRWTVPDPAGRQVTGLAARPLQRITDTAAVAPLVILLVAAAVVIGIGRRRAAGPESVTPGDPAEMELIGSNGPT